MEAPGDRLCSQCSRPLDPESVSEICSACHSGLYSLAIDEPDSDLLEHGEEMESPHQIWSKLSRVLPERDFIRELGRGGMGSVSLVYNRRLDRHEALKVLLPELSENPRFVERFLRESKVLNQLQHPNIVRIYDCSESDGILYLLMDYIDGGTLRTAITRGDLTSHHRIEVITQLASGLSHAHEKGIVHRDIKPANILLTKDGQVKIADFGLCTESSHTPSHLSVTRPLDVMGTYGYMAPEFQDGAKGIDARCDVYSLGVLSYEIFTQRLPQGVFQPPSPEAGVSDRFDDVILKALEQDPQRRYANAGQFLDAWQRAAESTVGGIATRPKGTRLGAKGASQTKNPVLLLAALLVLSGILFVSFRDQLGFDQQTGAGPIPNPEADSQDRLPKALVLPELDLHLKWVPPGRSIIGAMNADNADASPPLQIELSYGFWMGVYEITQLQYVTLIGNNPSHFDPERTQAETPPSMTIDWRKRPVESVTWREAMAFCAKLTDESRRSGFIPDKYRFRLPTEIEWEYVCRAGDRSVSLSDQQVKEISMQAWTFEDTTEFDGTREIGTKKPNAWGFFDLYGNVSEHCLNGWWYYPDFRETPILDWVDSEKQGDRIYRGGSFAQSLERANAFKRSSNAVDERDLAQGFRIVLAEELPFVRTLIDSDLPNDFELAALGLKLSWIPAGKFTMGEDSPSTPRGPAVFPPTPTTIKEGFWMAITEVSEFQWDRVINDDLTWLLPQKATWRDAKTDLPKSGISWTEATDFCHRLTLALESAGLLPEGFVIRLPTEAEWEWACRRDHETLFAFGNDPKELGIQFGGRARYLDNSHNSPGPVGEKGAAQSGLKGMYGNLREWCLDWKHSYPGNPRPPSIPQPEATNPQERSIRGGDFLSEAALCTGTARTFAPPEFKSKRIGFRLVLARPHPTQLTSVSPEPTD